MVVQQRAQIEIRERIARDDDERFVTEDIGCQAHGAGRSERRIFNDVRHRDPESGPVAKITFDLVGEVMQRRDDFGDAVVPEQIDDMLHHGLVDHRR